MLHKIHRLQKKFVLVVICCFLLVAIAPLTQGEKIDYIEGFDNGPSYTSIVPLQKVTFVGYDDETYLDDYSYLASLPTAVFREQNGDRLFSHPIMFYQDELDLDGMYDKYRSLDAYQGIEYFMEDWVGYCDNDELEQMTLINVDKNKINKEWDAKEYIEIDGENAYEISKEIALNDWSFSENAVVAVIQEDFKEADLEIKNSFTETFPAGSVKKLDPFNVDQTNSLNPVSKEFEVGSKYSFVKAEAWWDGVLLGGTMIPTGDPDLQLYCKKDGEWMQTVQTAQWNIYRPAGHEYTQSYVYSPGDWRVTITDFPTETEAPRKGIEGVFEIQGSFFNFLKPKVTYHVDITMFPGVTFDLPDTPPFGCRDAEIKLSWDDPSVCLGFTLIGPGGEAVYTELNESRKDGQEMYLDSLGQCLEGENYKVSVFALNDVSRNIDFTIEYTFKQEITKEESDSLTSATEGAVLASSLNAPLIYIKPNALPTPAKDALYELGVENIYLVDIGGDLNKDTKEKLQEIADISKNYKELKDIYDDIRKVSGSNDVVFTTIDPFTEWYVGELKPGEETTAALFIGPAAYIAAHHGTPVVIIDNHPRLSSAVVWHNEFWQRYSYERYDYKPSIAEMFLTGERIYDFLGDYGFDEIGDETIITVADQYDIGVPWDRIFPGVANSGRFIGTPIDTTVEISRSMFYPALIFENPALNPEGVTLINGSTSSREGILGLFKKPLLNTLVIKEGEEEEFEFPVLCSFVTHKYRFNERASNYYGAKYECADGKIPGEETSMQPIDQGSIAFHTDESGMYFPDISETEVIPFYLNKGGYDTAFSTNLDAVVNDLNDGVILWVHASHGVQPNGGSTLFWDANYAFKNNHKIVGIFAGAKYEENPWRGYDWELGSTEEPDTMSMDLYGFIPFTNHNSLIIPATGMDWVLARKPVREFLNNIIPFIDPFNVDNLYDGVTGSLSYSKYPLVNKNATEIEENLKNLHSAGFITGICQTSNTYFHLMMIRHGSVFQVQDPWPTSWYGAVWRQSIPRDIILGYTVGEAYSRGLAHVGSLYLGGGEDGPQWWWDDAENVVYFGDPDLRMYVPSQEYATIEGNNWDKDDVKPIKRSEMVEINGHTPFGATSHTKAQKEMNFFEKNMFILVILTIIILLLIALALMGRKK